MAAVGTQMRGANGGGSRLAMMQERMRENLRQEKESRMMEMVARQEADREERINRVKGSSATNSLSSSLNSLGFSGAGQGRVRKMLQDRRNHPTGRGFPSPKGFDKSYPLEPVKRDGGRPPAKQGAGGPIGRGVSVDRGQKQFEDASTNRSKGGQLALRANRGDNRQKPKAGTLGVPQKQYKSTSSLIDGGSRGPSPGPPSSTKSSPGPRGPVTLRRGPPPITTRKPAPTGRAPPVSPRTREPAPSKPIPSKRPQNLAVNGNHDKDDAPVSPSQAKTGGFFAKLGFNKSKPAEPAPTAPPRGNKFNAAGKMSPNPAAAQPPKKTPSNLPECKICGRNFAEDRIKKHQEICAKSKNKSKKRKVFDPSKMRTRGTEAEKYVLRGDHKKKQPKPKKKDWRKTHEDLINTLRAAKGVPGVVAPPTDTSDYIKCPHCGRSFSEGAADRHIPKCADIKSNKRR